MADNTRRLAGLVQLSIDGSTFEVASGAKHGLSRVERATLDSQSGIAGYKESPKAGFIEAVIRDAAGYKAGDFQNMTNVPVVLTLANGKNVTGSNMWNTAAVEVDNAEATFTVRFEGVTVTEE